MSLGLIKNRQAFNSIRSLCDDAKFYESNLIRQPQNQDLWDLKRVRFTKLSHFKMFQTRLRSFIAQFPKCFQHTVSICCLVSCFVHWRTWRKWTPRDFAPWIFMAGKLCGSGKNSRNCAPFRNCSIEYKFRLKYRYWYRLRCIGIRYNTGIDCWLLMNRIIEVFQNRCHGWSLSWVRWSLLKRFGPLTGWVGELDELQTTEPMPICGCLSAAGRMHAFDARLLLAVWQKTKLTCWGVERNDAINNNIHDMQIPLDQFWSKRAKDFVTCSRIVGVDFQLTGWLQCLVSPAPSPWTADWKVPTVAESVRFCVCHLVFDKTHSTVCKVLTS